MSMKPAIMLYLIFFSKFLFPCTCEDTLSVQESYKISNYIFSGRVIKIEAQEINIDGTTYYADEFKVTFAVDTVFKGKQEAFIEVFSEIQNCGFIFDINRNYLVYAYSDYKKTPLLEYQLNNPSSKQSEYNLKNIKKVLCTDMCTRTKRMHEASYDLSILKKFTK